MSGIITARNAILSNDAANPACDDVIKYMHNGFWFPNDQGADYAFYIWTTAVPASFNVGDVVTWFDGGGQSAIVGAVSGSGSDVSFVIYNATQRPPNDTTVYTNQDGVTYTSVSNASGPPLIPVVVSRDNDVFGATGFPPIITNPSQLAIDADNAAWIWQTEYARPIPNARSFILFNTSIYNGTSNESKIRWIGDVNYQCHAGGQAALFKGGSGAVLQTTTALSALSISSGDILTVATYVDWKANQLRHYRMQLDTALETQSDTLDVSHNDYNTAQVNIPAISEDTYCFGCMIFEDGEEPSDALVQTALQEYHDYNKTRITRDQDEGSRRMFVGNTGFSRLLPPAFLA